jgi:hypothetical protein
VKCALGFPGLLPPRLGAYRVIGLRQGVGHVNRSGDRPMLAKGRSTGPIEDW